MAKSLASLKFSITNGTSSKGASRGVQDVPYSLEIAGSNPGYVTADRDREFLGGGTQLAERCPGKEGLGQQGNPRLTTHQRPLWPIGHLWFCSGAARSVLSSGTIGLVALLWICSAKNDGLAGARFGGQGLRANNGLPPSHSKGYTDVVTIPEGSTHIKIRQFKPKDQQRYTAYLALKKKSGDYLVNGKFMISTSESIIDLNGTIMNYSGWSQRDDFLHSMGPGSLREVIIVQILATDARQALDVRYSFFMPKKLAPPASATPQGKGQKAPAPPQTPQWVTGPWLACSRTCDTGWQTRTVQCQDRPNKLAKGCQLKQRPSAFKQCLLKKC
ncbi:UNVERIFIED_CONTAM: hypothetical protein FKN15_067110 [Acipenser sinensis]